MVLGIPKRTLIIIAVLVGVVLIYALGADKRTSSGATPGSTGCVMTVTADLLNVRSAPDPNAAIVGKFKRDAQTGAELEAQNGFRKLGDNRWAAAEFLKPAQGNCG